MEPIVNSPAITPAPAAPAAAPQPAQAPVVSTVDPEPDQIAYLRENPDQAAEFDELFGAGKSQFYLEDAPDTDLTGKIADVIRGGGRGVLKAVDATSKLVVDSVNAGVEAVGGPKDALPDPLQYADAVDAPTTTAGGVTEALTQTLVGFFGAGKLTGLSKLKNLGVAGTSAKFAAQGAVGDFVVFNEQETKLSNVIAEKFPAVKDAWYLSLQSEEDDNFVIGRLKGAAEGVILGGVLEGLLWSAKSTRAWYRGNKAEATRAAEYAARAARGESVPPAVAPVAPAVAPVAPAVPAAAPAVAPNGTASTPAAPTAPAPAPAVTPAAPVVEAAPLPEPPVELGGVTDEFLNDLLKAAENPAAADVTVVPFRADKYLDTPNGAKQLMGALAERLNGSDRFSVESTEELARNMARELQMSPEQLVADISFGVRNDQELAAQIQARMMIYGQAGVEADLARARWASLPPGPEKDAALALVNSTVTRLVHAQQAASAPASSAARALRQLREQRTGLGPSPATRDATAAYENSLKAEAAGQAELAAAPEVKAAVDEADDVLTELDEFMPEMPSGAADEFDPTLPGNELNPDIPGTTVAKPKKVKKDAPVTEQKPKMPADVAVTALANRVKGLRKRIDGLREDFAAGRKETVPPKKPADPNMDATEALLRDSVVQLRDLVEQRAEVIARELDEAPARGISPEAAAKRAEEQWGTLVSDYTIGAAERLAEALERRAAAGAAAAGKVIPPEFARLRALIKEEDRAFREDFNSRVAGPNRAELQRGRDAETRANAPGPGRPELSRAEAAKKRLAEATRRLKLGAQGRLAEDELRKANPEARTQTSEELRKIAEQRKAEDATLRAERDANRAAGKDEGDLAVSVSALDPKRAEELEDLLKGVSDPALRRQLQIEVVTSPSTSDVLIRSFKNLLVSGLGTHGLGLGSNILNMQLQMTKRALAGAFAGDQKAVAASTRAFVEQFSGIAQAAKAARATFVTGRSRLGGAGSFQEDLKDPRYRLKNLSNIAAAAKSGNAAAAYWYGAKQLASDFALRGLGAGDEFIKQIAYNSTIRGEAYAEGVSAGLSGQALKDFIASKAASAVDAQTGAALNDAALDFARRVTFTEKFRKDTVLHQAGSALSQLTNTPNAFGRIAATILPFVGTPARVADQFWQDSILNGSTYLELISKDKDVRANALARLTVGASFSAMAAGLVATGYMTGSGPTDPELKKVWNQGNRDYSVNGVKISRLDPGATHMGVMADILTVMNAVEDSKDKEDLFKTASALMARQFQSKLFFTGVADFMEAATDTSGEAGKKLIGRYVSTVAVPPILAQFNTDPYLREARTLVDGIKRRTPGYSKELDVSRDFLGQAIMAPTGETWLPVTMYEGEKDPVGEAVISVFTAAGAQPSKPSVIFNGVDLRDVKKFNPELDRQQSAYDRMQQIVHQDGLRERLGALMKTPQFTKLADIERKEFIVEQIETARGAARAKMFKEYRELLEPQMIEKQKTRQLGDRNDLSVLLKDF